MVVVGAALVALGVLGSLVWQEYSAPTNKDECLAKAAKLPSEQGVRLAVSQCEQVFVTRPRAEAERQLEAERAEEWKRIVASADVTGKDIDRRLGVAGLIVDEVPCKHGDGTCYLVQWPVGDNSLKARMAQVNTSTGLLAGYWDELVDLDPQLFGISGRRFLNPP